MNSFQITDQEGNAIPIKELDKQAAEFWKKPLDDKYYANPTPKFTNPDNLEGNRLSAAKLRHEMGQSGNWFDVIGWNIAQQGNECSGWSNVVATMMAMRLGMKFIDLSGDYKTGPAVINRARVVEPGTDNEVDINTYVGKTIDIKFSNDTLISLWGTLEYFRPYIELINHWQSMGYVPKQIKE